jgi:hypothetical protein
LPALSECGGEPSAADIEKAVRPQVEMESEQMKKASMGLFDIKAEVHSVQKVGCVAATESTGFNCDVEMDVSNRLGRKKQGRDKHSFRKRE